MPTIEALFAALLKNHGPQGWWPLLEWDGEAGIWTSRYHPGVFTLPTESQRFEVGVGAILTQNTQWRGASLALVKLKKAGLLSPQVLQDEAQADWIRDLIRPSGFFNQKSERLRRWAAFYAGLGGRLPERGELLALQGIGPETADSILLYAYGQARFVADAYGRRIVGRLLGRTLSYDQLAAWMEREDSGAFDRQRFYNEGHALLVEHGKRFCRKTPLCGACFLQMQCVWAQTGGAGLDGGGEEKDNRW